MVEPGADHAEGDAPDGDADDEVAVSPARFQRIVVSQTHARIATRSVSP